MSSRWCGVTSAVTRQPLDFAQRMISTDPAVDTWQTCSAEPTWAASRQSRAMIASSATAGQPVRPSLAGHLPLVELRALGEPGFLGVLRDHPVERLDVLQRPAHQQRVGHAAPVVGEHPDPRRPSRPSRRARPAALPARPTVTAPTGRTSHVPGLPPEPPDLLHHAGGVRRPARCWPSRARRCSRRARRPGCRSPRSRRPRGPARAGACAGRPGRAGRSGPPRPGPARRRRGSPRRRCRSRRRGSAMSAGLAAQRPRRP